MTAKELSENIGKDAILTVPFGKGENLRIPVRVTDCRMVWGRTDYQINFRDQLVWASELQVKIERQL